MRPVNLIPADERRGDAAKSRTGPLVYVLVGALFAILAGVAVLALTTNQISDRKDELSQLKVEAAAAEARAQQLSAYTKFHQVSLQRTQTIASLADSRFDWERVIRELSLVLPSDVWLTSLTGTASPATTVEGSTTIATRAAVPGPALELVGCAPGQASVARLITALHEIDGVTRVGINKSALPASGTVTGGDTGSTGSDTECQARDFLAKFEIVVAFDAAPVPAAADATTAAAPAAPVPAPTDSSTPTSASTGG
jgi:Tfp pilus assembly protein PilN